MTTVSLPVLGINSSCDSLLISAVEKKFNILVLMLSVKEPLLLPFYYENEGTQIDTGMSDLSGHYYRDCTFN